MPQGDVNRNDVLTTVRTRYTVPLVASEDEIIYSVCIAENVEGGSWCSFRTV
jgi:hypothetical protein